MTIDEFDRLIPKHSWLTDMIGIPEYVSNILGNSFMIKSLLLGIEYRVAIISSINFHQLDSLNFDESNSIKLVSHDKGMERASKEVEWSIFWCGKHPQACSVQSKLAPPKDTASKDKSMTLRDSIRRILETQTKFGHAPKFIAIVQKNLIIQGVVEEESVEEFYNIFLIPPDYQFAL